MGNDIAFDDVSTDIIPSNSGSSFVEAATRNDHASYMAHTHQGKAGVDVAVWYVMLRIKGQID